MDFQHRLPNELLAEIIKFTELVPMDNPKSSPHNCCPKNPAILLANSVLYTFAKKMVDAADPFFKKRHMKLSAKLRKQLWASDVYQQQQAPLAIQMHDILQRMEMEIDENDDE